MRTIKTKTSIFEKNNRREIASISTYNKNGLLIRNNYPNGCQSIYEYDDKCNLIFESRCGGVHHKYSYDKLNRLVIEEIHTNRVSNRCNNPDKITTVYQYIDDTDKISKIFKTTGETISYTYYDNSYIRNINNGRFDSQYEHIFDDRGNLIEYSKTGVFVEKYEYDKNNNITRSLCTGIGGRVYEDLTIENIYDNKNRLKIKTCNGKLSEYHIYDNNDLLVESVKYTYGNLLIGEDSRIKDIFVYKFY